MKHPFGSMCFGWGSSIAVAGALSIVGCRWGIEVSADEAALTGDADSQGMGGAQAPDGGSDGSSDGTGGSDAMGTGGNSSGGADDNSSGGTGGNGTGGDSSGETGGQTSSGGMGGQSTGATCGDGVVGGDEACDDGGESATCNDDCTTAECGDGVLNASAGEECEPSSEQHCTGSCNFSYTYYLAHRFSFKGAGAEAVDSVGDGTGPIYNTTLDGSGQFVMDGTAPDAHFATLRNGLASEKTNATFEAWVTWDGGDPWQRIFDFGNSTSGEQVQGVGATYIFLTPYTSIGDGPVRAAFSTNEIPEETFVEGTAPLPIGTEVHVAVVFDDARDSMQLYVNGALVGQTAWTESLSILDDINNWIGISQYSWDPNFDGSINEFRIYDAALSDQQIQNSFDAGPDL